MFEGCRIHSYLTHKEECKEILPNGKVVCLTVFDVGNSRVIITRGDLNICFGSPPYSNHMLAPLPNGLVGVHEPTWSLGLELFVVYSP